MFFRITGIKRQVLICSVRLWMSGGWIMGMISVYLGQIMAGFSITWPGSVIPILQNQESPLPYNLTETELSLVATIVMIASVPAPYTSGWLSNKIGRKPCLIASGAMMILGYAILAGAKNLAMLYSGRFVIGFGGGITNVISVVYIGEIAYQGYAILAVVKKLAMLHSGRYVLGFGGGITNVISVVYLGEIASKNIRGILLSGMGLFMTCGTMLLFVVSPFTSYLGINSVGLGLSIAFTLSTIMLSETPVFFILKGDDIKVKEVLEDLGRLEDVDKLLATKHQYTDTSNKKDWKDLFYIKSNRRALLITTIINILQNCSGLTAVIIFSGSIFKMAGSSIDANVSMIIVSAFQLLGSLLTPFFIERIGRKTILMISCAACCVFMFLLGLYFYFNHIDSPLINNLKWLPLVFIVLYFISYNFGYGIIPNTIFGEMFTTNVRSNGSSVTMSVSWIFGFIVNTAFGVILKVVGGHFVFWFFSVVCACAFTYTIFCIPETKGKSLAEIQEHLSK